MILKQYIVIIYSSEGSDAETYDCYGEEEVKSILVNYREEIEENRVTIYEYIRDANPSEFL